MTATTEHARPARYERTWGDEVAAPVPAPTVLISSRDGADVPRVAGVVKLVKLAGLHGWAVLDTFAMAEVPERLYLNGTVAKAAHTLLSVAVRLARGGVRAWAIWHSEDGSPWRFVDAYVGHVRLGLRALLARVEVYA